VENFAKFHGAISESPRHYYPRIPYIQWLVGVVVLTDNNSKYKEFIITCSTKTHYIRPIIMNTHNYHKSKLKTNRFYYFINGKIENKPEKP